jgi:3-oxoacyl-(acyl-carrier-protein) synthase/NAD(P)H-dependent flavin oxidoreductase YrpB (nitropropane dioxygenase family)
VVTGRRFSLSQRRPSAESRGPDRGSPSVHVLVPLNADSAPSAQAVLAAGCGVLLDLPAGAERPAAAAGLARPALGGCGLRLATPDVALLPDLRLPQALVTAPAGEERVAVEACRQIADRVLVEVGSLAAALRAEEAGADGLVAAGSEAGQGSRSSYILLQELAGRLRIPVWARGGIGPATGAAAVVAGATGVVLDGEVASGRSPDTVRLALAAVRSAMHHLPGLAAEQPTLRRGSPWAVQHGLDLPLVQGPMTRVSDTPPFARAVAAAGALPCLAIGVLDGESVGTLLAATAALLGDLPFGVGLLGFAPRALREEQLAAVLAARPRLAVIAGGRPEQAIELERAGIAAYLHAPSPELARRFVEAGATRLVLEGREAGGHVGPRTSFELWPRAVEALLAARRTDLAAVSVLFAGGIHDALSAAMAATVAAPLVAAGVRVGLLAGSAYLFTREATESGAITPGFQEQALACRETTLLETGPGWATRCAPTPYCEEFAGLRAALVTGGVGPDELVRKLEAAHVGRLRLAAKGARRDAAGEIVKTGPAEQLRDGLYMLGEAATLRSEMTSIAELHAALTIGASALLPVDGGSAEEAAPQHEPVAIVGMACLFPGAASLREYWDNILGRVDATRDVDPARWLPELFHDPARRGRDSTPSTRGGFLDPIVFDPARYGIPPSSLAAIEPVQLLALEVAARALEDAGPAAISHHRDRCAVVVGIGGAHDLGNDYAFRTLLPQHLARSGGMTTEARDALVARLSTSLPEWTEDSFPGFLGNVVAGRIANRLDLRGPNFTVDAACASSLAALDVGLRLLRTGAADVAVVGAVDGTNHAPGYLAFASTHALSSAGRCRPFDEGADGTVISEGAAVIVLKRLGEAVADGDRVWAVLRGTGASSDGRSTSLTAPHPDGQRRALERAYRDAGVNPLTVGLVEAHGTGTRVGDPAEIEALGRVFAGGEPRRCALGSVKSGIGHTKVVAGLAGLIKSALALHDRVLPPTLGIETPNRAVDWESSPFFLCTEALPWLPPRDHPRRAGVSAFGFGGSNFHAVLEEAARPIGAADLGSRPVEVVAFAGDTPADLAVRLEQTLKSLGGEDLALADVAAAISRETGWRSTSVQRLAIVARSIVELRARIALALGEPLSHRPEEGLFAGSNDAPGKLAVVFPGRGVQRVGMLGELLIGSHALEERLAVADALLTATLPARLSSCLFPSPVLSEEERAAAGTRLDAPEVAQPALAAVQMAAWDLLRELGVAPASLAGHEFGEYTARCAAGTLSYEDLLLVAARGDEERARVGRSGLPAKSSLPRFLDEIRTLHDEGVRVFLDAGPDASLAGLVASCLEGRGHETLSLDPPGARGWNGAAQLLARLWALGFPVRPDAWYAGREVRGDSLEEVLQRSPAARTSATAWLISPGRAEPLGDGRPARARPSEGGPPPGLALTVPASDDDLAGLLEEQARLLRRSREVEERVRALTSAAPQEVSYPPIAVPEPPAPTSGDDALPTADVFQRHLLSAVAASTGYPEAMLGLDAALEADLGVDSIKRLEILMDLPELKELRRRRGDPDDERILEALWRLTTLRRVVSWYEAERQALASAAPPAAVPSAPRPEGPEDPIARHELRTVARPLVRGAPPRRGLTAVVAGEAELIAGELAAALRSEGWRVREVADGDRTVALGDHRFLCDFRSLRQVEALRRLLRAHGDEPAALFNLLPLSRATSRRWGAGDHARSLFAMVRAFGPSLAASGTGGWLVNVTGLDGAFGLGRGGDVEPMGTHGVARSAGREWGALRVTCVDLDPVLDPTDLAGALAGELSAERTALPIDVGLGSGGRVQLVTEPAEARHESLRLPDDALILATGGGAGITAAILESLVASIRAPRVVVVGRSTLTPAEDETSPGAVEETTIRETLVRRAVAAGLPPASVERELARRLRRQELRRNLDALEALGAEVHYESLDVTDGAAFDALISRVYRRWGRIDGVIHGAGIVRDRLIRSKTRASFDEVFATKVAPARVLEHALRPDALRFVLFLSSVAGRFGNVGQADYAAANQVLSALAWRLSRLWPHVRTLAVDWGPWEAGMVGEGLRRLYLERGIRPIPTSEGVRLCLEELAGAGPPEVVLARSLPAIASYRVGGFRP